MDIEQIGRRLRVARGLEPADVVLRHARIVNTLSGEIHSGDVAIADGFIAAVGTHVRGIEERDLQGRYLTPGLIDGHMHLESTMMVPGQFARAVVPRGTTTVIVDPHEFANVLGVEGIHYVLEATHSLPLDVFVTLSSCVPASPLESPHTPLLADDLLPLLDDPRVVGLAEMMDVHGVLRGDDNVLAKIAATRARRLRVDGHAPGVRGADLNAYVAAGIQSDHESIVADEARDKLRRGLWLMVREGSAARNLAALLPLLAELRPSRALFVTDDRDPLDLLARGHIDSMVGMALDFGLDPVETLRLASYNAAQYFGLHDRGAIAPGYRADLLVVEDMPSFKISEVYKDGRRVAEHGRLCVEIPVATARRHVATVQLAALSPDALRLDGRTGPATVIGIEPGQITTVRLTETVSAPDGIIQVDRERDLLKLIAVERHHRSGRVGVGLVKGFGLRRGALASSVAHDAHNIVAVGAADADLVAATRAIEAMGGGFAVVSDGHVVARVPLPLAGLVSDEPLEVLAAQLEAADEAAAALGCRLDHPFMTLSFLSLSVIPELRLTDHGLVDVVAAQVVPLQS